MRVYELARELGLTSKELLSRLKEMGIEVASHSSSLDDARAAQVRERLQTAPSPPGATEEERKETPARPAVGKLSAEEEVVVPEAVPRPQGEVLVIKFPVTVRQLAEYIGQRPNILIKKLLEMGVFASLNQFLDEETAIILGGEYDREIRSYAPQRVEGEGVPSVAPRVPKKPVPEGKNLRPRSPVVTLMGHIDHGKTSILDAVRKSRITSGEAGGITQHIGAYRVETEHGDIVFLDTPGHAAFTTMRARGADLTDIVILVVAADEGIMPQTEEAINHARAANVPIIVALNKIDKSTARADRVRRQLAEHGLQPEEMGGDTICVELSAVTGVGLVHLLEMILLQAEMMELKADPDGPASGAVIEARLTSDRGPVATVLVKNGTLKRGDSVVCDMFSAKVKGMFDDRGSQVKTAGPSTPVEIMGLTGVPEAGSSFQVVESDSQAREISHRRREELQEKTWDASRRMRLEDFFQQIASSEVKELALILKGDVQGSVEAVAMALKEVAATNQSIKLNIVHSGAGGISESDVMLAAASRAVIIGFQLPLNGKIKRLADEEGVDIRCYQIIYEAVDDVRKALEGLLEPELKEVILGEARVKEVFKISGLGFVAGSIVESGKIKRGSRVRIMRGEEEIATDSITSLKRFKDTVEEVAAGKECGVTLGNFNDFQEDDRLISFQVDKIPKKL